MTEKQLVLGVTVVSLGVLGITLVIGTSVQIVVSAVFAGLMVIIAGDELLNDE